MNGLAVQREIETLALHLIADAQSDEDVDDLEDDQRHDGVVDEDDDDAFDLVDYLHRVAFDQAGRAAVLLDREHAGEQRADAAAAFTWMLVEWMMRGKPTVVGICTGAVAGLVAITPASGFVGPVGSLCIGIAAGILCYWGCTGLKRMLGYDDALDAFGVHAVGGMVGALLTGVFAIEQYGGTAGLIEGNAVQVLNQIEGIVIVFVYGAIVSLIILKLVDMFIGLRVSDEVEREGLDLALHGETVH